MSEPVWLGCSPTPYTSGWFASEAALRQSLAAAFKSSLLYLRGRLGPDVSKCAHHTHTHTHTHTRARRPLPVRYATLHIWRI